MLLFSEFASESQISMTFCRFISCLIVFCQGAVSTFEHARQNPALDVLDYVDPLIGSRNGGNVFAGATLPYGLAKGSLQANKLAMLH